MLIAALAAGGAARGQGFEGIIDPTSQPTTLPEPWGGPKAGLQCSLVLQGQAQVGGKFVFQCALRNNGSAPIALGDPKKIFGWLFIAMGKKKKNLYTDRVYLAQEMTSNWLEGGKTYNFKPLDLTETKVFAFQQGMKVADGYFVPAKGAEEPQPVGTLTKSLAIGQLQAKLMLHLPREGEPPLLLASNTVDVLVHPPEMNALPPEHRKAFVEQLLARFDKDAWAGMAAHHDAVRLGKDVVGDLIAGLGSARPAHSLMWMATAVCDIPCPEAGEGLVKLLEGSNPSITHVIAYHGPKQKNEKLDQAIIAKVQARKDARMTALAVLGFMGARGVVPDEILKVGLESDDPRARGTVVEAFASHAGEANVLRAVALLKDKDEKVRGVAARVLGGMNNRSGTVIAALVEALDTPGDYARHRICEALSALAEKDLPYDPKADEQARQKVVTQWKAWWAQVRKEKTQK